MAIEALDTGAVLDELNGLDLGDARLNRRAGTILEAWAQDPSLSLPQAMESEAALEGAYRWANND